MPTGHNFPTYSGWSIDAAGLALTIINKIWLNPTVAASFAGAVATETALSAAADASGLVTVTTTITADSAIDPGPAQDNAQSELRNLNNLGA